MITGEIRDVTGVATGSLRTAFAEGLVPLLWAIAAASAVLTVVVVVLLRRTPEPPDPSEDVNIVTSSVAQRDPIGVAEAANEHTIDSRAISERTPR